MPPTNFDLRPTVWERLSGDPSRAPKSRFNYGLADAREALRTDLTRLLNTTSCCLDWEECLDELSQSSLSYGVEDFTGVNVKNTSSREELRRLLETNIRRFEPRLSQVQVGIIDDGEHSDRTLRFRIQARLMLGEQMEMVSFESRLDPHRRRFLVQTTGR